MRNPPPPGQGPYPYGDPNQPTQPVPIVIPGAPPPPGAYPGGPQTQRAGKRAYGPGFDHRQGFWGSYLLARFFAFVIDVPGIAFILGAFAFDLVDHGSLALAPRHDQNGWFVVFMLSLGAAIALAFIEEAVLGTTLGKALFMLHVRRADGRREGFGAALTRYLVLPLDLLLIGPLMALVTPKHRRLGDVAAGTVVGRSPIGPIAIGIAAVILGALVYAQAAFGGGLTSAIGISAETATYFPSLIGGITGFAHGFGTGPGQPQIQPFSTATPAPQPVAPAEASPTPDETDEPETESTATPSGPA